MAITKEERQKSGEVTRQGQGTQVAPRRNYDVFSEFLNNPFSVMRRMHEEMDRIFADSFGGSMQPSAFSSGLSVWSPSIEISERDNEMCVCAELPGLRPEDVKVEVTDDALIIEGERKQEQEEKKEGRWRSERHYGRFHRTIPLPDGADAEHARADFKNGELRVTVPVQQAESKRRQIPINGTSAEQQTK